MTFDVPQTRPKPSLTLIKTKSPSKKSSVKNVQSSKHKRDQESPSLTLLTNNVEVLESDSFGLESQSSIQLDTSSLDFFKELGIESIKDESYILEEEQHDIFEDAQLTKKNLLSYIHLCIYNDQLAEAHAFLLEFIGKFSNSFTTTDIARCCELLVKGWARKGNTNNVKELISYIQNKLNVPVSLQIYEYHLLSLAKQVKQCDSHEIRCIVEDMRKYDLNPQDLTSRSTLNSNEINLIKAFVQKHGMSINKSTNNPSKLYNIDLVDKILANEQKRYDPFEGVDISGMDQMIDYQLKIEKESFVKITPIECCFNDLTQEPPKDHYKHLITQFEEEWTRVLEKAYHNYLVQLRSKQKRLNGIPFIHYMTILEPKVYLDAMIEEIRKCASFSEFYSPFAANLFETLGRKIMQIYLNRSNHDDGTLVDFEKCYRKYVEYTQNPDLIQKYNCREYWQHLTSNGYHFYFDESKLWSQNVLKEIGKELYEIIANEAKFNSLKMVNSKESLIQPVISFFYKNHDSFKTKKDIRVHPMLIKLYEGAGSSIHFESERLPMMSPPVPWINPSFGGNLLKTDFIIRLPTNYPKQRFKRVPLQQLNPTLDSLNALALCPWTINEKVFSLHLGHPYNCVLHSSF